MRGDRPAADVARQAGIRAAYLHAIENATPGGGGQPARPSVPVLRSLAEVLGASRAELLELAGHDQDAAYDHVKEARAARDAQRTAPALAAFAGKVGQLPERDRRIIERIVDDMLGAGDSQSIEE